MGWKQKEEAIRERRTIEATKKNLMGTIGKLGLIVKTLGHPIIRQGSSLCDINFLDDPYEDHSDIEFESMLSDQQGPVAWQDRIEEGGDEEICEEGYVFDGLSRGMHLEIKLWHKNARIQVTYKGFSVYDEIAGELATYAPFPEWEDMIDRLHKVAKTKAKKYQQFAEVEIGEEIQKEKQKFWERLRYRWGL